MRKQDKFRLRLGKPYKKTKEKAVLNTVEVMYCLLVSLSISFKLFLILTSWLNYLHTNSYSIFSAERVLASRISV